MTSETAPSPDLSVDPALAVAERQLVLLGELVEMAMDVSRAFRASAIAASQAEKAILAEDYFIPEVGRARACGAKDAAESFQKVSRALRLSMMLQMTVAETVRDLRAGVVAGSTAAASARGQRPARIVIGEVPAATTIRIEADSEGQSVLVERSGGERERLVDIEVPERLPRGSYCRLVDDLAADIGATVDWDEATVSAPASFASILGGASRGLNHQGHQDHQGVRAEPAPSG